MCKSKFKLFLSVALLLGLSTQGLSAYNASAAETGFFKFYGNQCSYAGIDIEDGSTETIGEDVYTNKCGSPAEISGTNNYKVIIANYGRDASDLNINYRDQIGDIELILKPVPAIKLVLAQAEEELSGRQLESLRATTIIKTQINLKKNNVPLPAKSEQRKKLTFRVEIPYDTAEELSKVPPNWQYGIQLSWHGNISSFGNTNLTFIGDFAEAGDLTGGKWRRFAMVHNKELPDSISYAFKLASQPPSGAVFETQVGLVDVKPVTIGSNEELAIHSGVKLSFMNGGSAPESSALVFASAESNNAQPGKLSFYLSDSTAPAKLLVLSQHSELKLQRLELHLAKSLLQKLASGTSMETQLIVAWHVLRSNPGASSEDLESAKTAICFSAELTETLTDCGALPPVSKYKVLNDHGPDLEIEIRPVVEFNYNFGFTIDYNGNEPGAAVLPRSEMIVRKWVDAETILKDGEIIKIIGYDDDNFETVLTSNTSLTQPTDSTLILFEKMIVNGTFNTLSEPALDIAADANDQSATLIASPWGNQHSLQTAINTQFSWARGKLQNKAQAQYYRLRLGGRYKQLAAHGTAFVNRTITSTTVNNLLGGVLHVSYLTPVRGLDVGLYLGGALTPKGNNRYKTITTGFTLNYQHRFVKTIGITLAPNLRLDLTPLFANTDGQTRKTLFLRGQAGFQLGLDTANSLGNYRLQMIVPLKLTAVGKFVLDQTTEKTYDFNVTTGVNLKLVALSNLSAQVGYEFAWSRMFTQHALQIKLALKV